MKQYNNGQRKGMMYGGMSRRKPMMYGGTATKPRKKAQMGGTMTATQKQQNQMKTIPVLPRLKAELQTSTMPMQTIGMQSMAHGGKAKTRG